MSATTVATERDAIEHIFDILFRARKNSDIYKACAAAFKWDEEDDDSFVLDEFITADVKMLEGIKVNNKLLRPFD